MLSSGFEPAAEQPASSSQLPPGITSCEDGKLRWIHEVNLWKNPVMSMSILKAMAGVTAGFSLLVFFVLLRDGFMEALVVLGKFLLFGLAGTLLLFGISYAIFALMNSGRYYVLFEMDGTGVNHIQIGKQVKKAKALGLLTSLVGVSARSISITGTGLIAGSKLSFYSDFGKVKRIVPMKKHDCIKLSGAFMKNQIYVTPEQFDFVWGYIISHTNISKTS